MAVASKTRDQMIKEYRLILQSDDGIDKPKKLSDIYFRGSREQAHEEACALFRFFFEEVWHCTPNEAFSLLDKTMIDNFHLKPAYNAIIFPEMLNVNTGYFYVAVACYPEVFKSFSERQLLVMEWNHVRSADSSSKKYFTGEFGRQKAALFLNFHYNSSEGIREEFETLEDMYLFFASKKAKKYIAEAKLDKAMMLHFTSPLIFFHESLSNKYNEDPKQRRNEFLFMYAEFMTKAGKNPFDMKKKRKKNRYACDGEIANTKRM